MKSKLHKDTFIETYDCETLRATNEERTTRRRRLLNETIDEIVISQLNSIDDNDFNKRCKNYTELVT